MDNFVGTTFVKLFIMYNACEGLLPFHSDVLPANGQREAQDPGKHFAPSLQPIPWQHSPQLIERQQ
jgi:hypothetical protein